MALGCQGSDLEADLFGRLVGLRLMDRALAILVLKLRDPTIPRHG